jgi:eukaryotic-like serine/threonine-protein kinase
MPDTICPSCGAPRPAHSPAGHCPRCLLLQGLDSDSEGLDRGSSDRTLDPTPPSSVLDTIAATIGAVPRVLLRDTAIGEEPSPIIRPASGDETSCRYRIDGEIAVGGMGSILKGRDPDIGRDVAIKVLRGDLRDNGDLVRRFVEEAQIGGQLQHPGIVPIYELGTLADHRPFFSMKLVKGRTLANLLADRTSPADDLPRFLSIFAAIAQTMAYAHTRGVIHRDLKPSNMMVGSFGEVQVMDWGLAKVLARGGVVDDARAGKEKPPETMIVTARSGSGEDLSHAGSVLGTPSYMAPEQARGETDLINERADVFALGSILAEILTGAPAFTGRSSGEIVRKASRGETAGALTRLDGCGAEGELIALVKDCLAVEPEDRPRDANVVAERTTAYLAGVQERLQAAERERAVAVARAVEERKQRRLQVGLAASLIGLMVLGGGGYAWNQQQRAERVARTTRAVDEALADAIRLQGEAQGAAPGEITRWAVAISAAKRAEGLLAQGEADEPLRDRVKMLLAQVERAQAAAVEKAARIAADRALLAELESIRGGTLEKEVAKQTDADYAAAFLKAGLDLDKTEPAEAGKWIAARSDPVELAGYLDDWSRIRKYAGQTEAECRRLTAAARAADPDPWRDALRARLGARDAGAVTEFRRLADDDKDLDAQPAPSLILLARQLKFVAGDRERAARVLRRAVFRYPGEFWAQLELGRVYAGSGQEPATQEESLRHLTAAIAIRPASPITHYLLGILLDNQRKRDQAAAECREAIRLKPDLVGARLTLGSLLEAQGKLDQAVAEFREAFRRWPDHPGSLKRLVDVTKKQGKAVQTVAEFREAVRLRPDDVKAHDRLARVFRYLGKYDEAVAEFREAVRLKPDNAEIHYRLAGCLSNQGKLDQAVISYREAIRLKPDYASAYNDLGHALGKQGKYDQAVAAHREGIRLSPSNALSHSNLGAQLQAQGHLDQAVAEYREAIQLSPDFPLWHFNLGNALRDQGKLDQAVAAYRESLRLYPGHQSGRINLLDVLKTQGRSDEMTSELRVVADWDRKRYGPADSRTSDALAQLGGNLVERSKWAEAEPVLRECLAIREKTQPDEWKTFNTRSMLGASLLGQKKYAEAEPLILSGYEGLKARAGKIPDNGLQRLAEAAELIVSLYNAWGKKDQAVEWRARLTPKTSAERHAFADLCYDKKQFAAAARLRAEALEADPSLGESRAPQHRYNAACNAALAASGQAKDDPPPDDAARAMFRNQALKWLKAELGAWEKVLVGKNEQDRAKILSTLRHWKVDTDLASIRDSEQLSKLSAGERKTLQTLWADVDVLLKRAAGKAPATR